ncbi:MAG: phosphodiester glycosidase family protein [Clostridia bacterium]|nr:phosphodiester glycosidase family protein [Clostridia bacterium]
MNQTPKKRERKIAFSSSDYLDYAGFQRRTPKKRMTAGTVVRRSLLVFFSLLLFIIISVYTLVFTVAHGPSETVRDLLVQAADQASATKWVPYLFLDKSTVKEILDQGDVVSREVISLQDYADKGDDKVTDEKDEWEGTQDGLQFFTVKGATYTAYMMIVKDPSRVFVGTSSDFKSGKQGINIFDGAKKYGAVAAINAGEFSDPGGVGTGDNPIGLTYSQGNCVWNDGQKRTFIGIDKNDRLVVSEPMTKAKAEELGIRDAVSFQRGNVLITNDGDNITLHRADGNTGTAQRTAIGQRADGAIILLVTDGRTASSIGATHNDVIDIMVEYGAVTAGMLDGGSSAMMYYENYFDKYGYDVEKLDKYQKRGLVNKYKAFTTPRKMPTFFMVAPVSDGTEG